MKSKDAKNRILCYRGVYFQNEIIELLVGAIKIAQYFSIILDSVPHISHVLRPVIHEIQSLSTLVGTPCIIFR